MGKTAFLGMVLVVSALLACAGASHEMVGDRLFAIDCKRNASNCYEEAGKVCPSGFDVVDAQGQQGAFVTSGTVVPTYKGSMLVRCKAPAR